MPDAVTILHVSDPVSHAPGSANLPARVTVSWHLLHAGSPMVPGDWYSVALQADVTTRLESILESLGFSSVTRTYMDESDSWPIELPLPGYVRPTSGAAGAQVRSALIPRPAMVTARAVWSGRAVHLGQVGLGSRAVIVHYGPHDVQPRATDGQAFLLPSGLWISGAAVGNCPDEVAAKLAG
jgi:hypothetical protein